MTQMQTQMQVGGPLAGYKPPSGVFDEAVAEDGQVRPAMQALLDGLNQMGDGELRKRWNQAQSQLDRNGITFNPYDDSGLVSRPWTLDAIPMAIADTEWKSLAEKLAQRARVLEALLGDLLGSQHVLREKILPPELLFSHPAWYPSYQGLYGPEQRYLTYSATDLARAPDGRWWATGDRTRSPFGLGYVLENRIVSSRMLSDVYRSMPVRRLAGYYAALKEELRRQAERSTDNPRIVVWTKGPQSRGYFEDSYLARYLGYTLAEGDDLAVRNNSVNLLTLGGLVPVDILLRRVNDDDCDSVELNPTSEIGISSLLDVLRDRQVTVANAIGSRLVESPAFLPFLRAVSTRLLGEDLQLPSVATWWCGDPKACKHVIANLDRLLVRPAFRMDDVRPVIGEYLSAKEREELAARIKAQPETFVGQEIVKRSTSPVMTSDGVVPWYMSLRTFLLHTRDRLEVLPGGLARVSPDSHSLNFTMTAGERSQDVWLVADGPVEETTLLEISTRQVEPRRSGSELPSRVADNLFWLGRYTERSRQTARLLWTLLSRIESENSVGQEATPLFEILSAHGLIDTDDAPANPDRNLNDAIALLPSAIFDTNRNYSLISSVNDTTRTANRVRDRISTEMWQAIERLDTHMQLAPGAGMSRATDLIELLETAMGHLAALTGMVADGLTRTLGWRFYDLGVRIERCWQTATILKCFFAAHKSEDPDSLETVLTLTDGLMTYRNRYLSTFQVPVTLDLLMTDTTNPRSMIYQLIRINEHLDAMPGCENQAVLHPEQKLAMSIANSVRLLDVYELSQTSDSGRRPQLDKLLSRIDDRLPGLADTVTSRYLIHAGLPRHFGSTAHSAALYHRLSTDPQGEL